MSGFRLGAKLRATIVELRDLVRLEEGGSTDPKIAGGQCGELSLCLTNIAALAQGEPYLCGAYVSDDDTLVWDHCWLDLSDGSILDATADQFDEGDNVRLVRPGGRRYKRYLRWDEFAQVAADLEARATRLGSTRVLAELAELRGYVFMEGGAAEANALMLRLRTLPA